MSLTDKFLWRIINKLIKNFSWRRLTTVWETKLMHCHKLISWSNKQDSILIMPQKPKYDQRLLLEQVKQLYEQSHIASLGAVAVSGPWFRMRIWRYGLLPQLPSPWSDIFLSYDSGEWISTLRMSAGGKNYFYSWFLFPEPSGAVQPYLFFLPHPFRISYYYLFSLWEWFPGALAHFQQSCRLSLHLRSPPCCRLLAFS